MSETVESRKVARDIKAECRRLGIVPDALCESCGYAVCDHQPAILAYRVALAARDEELAEAKAALLDVQRCGTVDHHNGCCHLCAKCLARISAALKETKP